MKEENRIHSLNAIKLNRAEMVEGENIMKIEGYACHFDKVNKNGEIVHESSFEKFFKDLNEGGLMPVFNYNHNNDFIVGGWDEIKSDKTGLYVKGHLNTDVAYVRDNILPLVKSGDIDGLSIEGYFNVETAKFTESGVDIKDYQLIGISLVALPADFSARVESKNYIALKRKEECCRSNNDLLIL